jgi:Gas vesicle synthesis protein GvpL/GvpF
MSATATERGSARYVYCILGAREQPPLSGLAGVDGAGVEPVAEGELCALTSVVPLARFGERALREQLEDIDWVERTARAHDAVIARALAAEAVVPLRLCTLFADERQVRAMLQRECARLRTVLRDLRGQLEWSVKASADEQAMERAAAAPADTPSAEAAPGRAFFAQRRSERGARERAWARATAAAEAIHDRLRAEATAATVLPPQRRALSGRAGTMVLNGAYLVPRSRAQAFASAVDELTARHRADGIELALDGPWAPYNFVEPERTDVDGPHAPHAGDSA